MRLIDADALKEKLEAWKKEAERRDANINYAFAFAIIAQVNAEPTIEERKWIPCSERLPQPNEEDADGFIKAYLVQDSRWMDVARWNGDCWIAWGYGTALTNVIAWMPLPEPYKGGQDGH